MPSMSLERTYDVVFNNQQRAQKFSLLSVTDIPRTQIVVVPWYPYPVFYVLAL